MKRIRKHLTYMGMIVLTAAILGLKYTALKQPEERYEPVSARNVCIGMCYHYIREKTLWNLALEKLTGSNELVTYTVYKDEFEHQIQQLIESGAYFATLDEIEKFRQTGVYPEKCVWLCFDDGDESVYKEAFPFLEKNNIPFTMFIIAGEVGNNDFDNLKLCSWDELREMKESGLVSFGSHTYDMHYLKGSEAIFLDEDMYNRFYEDIRESREVIESKLATEVDSIAYPFGDTSDGVTEIVQKAGFSNAFILAPHPLDAKNDAYYQNRYMIDRKNFYKIYKTWLVE